LPKVCQSQLARLADTKLDNGRTKAKKGRNKINEPTGVRSIWKKRKSPRIFKTQPPSEADVLGGVNAQLQPQSTAAPPQSRSQSTKWRERERKERRRKNAYNLNTCTLLHLIRRKLDYSYVRRETFSFNSLHYWRLGRRQYQMRVLRVLG
jgi:hypothetical protein